MPETIEKQSFEGFAILELMGHRKLAGYVKQVEIFGAPMCRVDVPEGGDQEATTQFYSAGAIYCLTPTTEDVVKRMAEAYRPAPVNRFELPSPKPATAVYQPVPRAERDDRDLSDVEFGDDDNDEDDEF